MPLDESILENLLSIVGVENVLTAIIPYAFDSAVAVKETLDCGGFGVSTDEISEVFELANNGQL